MPEYELRLRFTAANADQADRLARAWAGTCAAEYGTRYAGCDRVLPEPSRLPGGEWRCILDHQTEPCGECSGCREVQDVNRLSRQDKIEAGLCGTFDERYLPGGVFGFEQDGDRTWTTMRATYTLTGG